MMKREFRIDPYNYPIIIIAAFVIGFTLALALGFRPEHGGGGMASLPWVTSFR